MLSLCFLPCPDFPLLQFRSDRIRNYCTKIQIIRYKFYYFSYDTIYLHLNNEIYNTQKDSKSNARLAEFETAHGVVETPIFMPVGTAGTVKGIHQHEIEKDILAQIILGNTYHLYLRPGLDVIESTGGLHKFIGWNKPLLTDSGGYQVYSLSGQEK